MEKLMIHGGASLSGTVAVSDAKNAALPILAASLLCEGPSHFKSIPHLRDITTMLSLLGGMGVRLCVHDGGVLSVDASHVTSFQAPYELVKTMRASILVLGPLLARFHKAEVSLPGGCAIGSRPVDLHLKALEQMGARITLCNGFIHAEAPEGLHGAEITFDQVTVTGTENIMMAACLAKGRTVLSCAAAEPEVYDLACFLNAAGARIEGAGTDTIVIEGVEALRGAAHTVVPDRIEAGTFMVAALMTRGDVTLTHVCPDHLGAVIDACCEAGGVVEVEQDSLRITMAERPKAVSLKTAPYPGFPTDMQAQFLAMNTMATGSARVEECIFENRFMHVHELQRMGAIITLDASVARVCGRQHLLGAPVMATDLRASAALVLAGLVAHGVTLINRVYHMDRGYERIEEKFSQLGARIQRVSADASERYADALRASASCMELHDDKAQ